MASDLSYTAILPPHIYTQLAKTCQECEMSKGSEKYSRGKKCCFCGRNIGLGAGKDNDHSLIQHMLSFDCQDAQIKLRDSGSLSSWVPPEFLVPSQAPSHNQPPDVSLSSSSTSFRTSAPARSGAGLTSEGEPCPGAFVDYGTSIFSHYPMHLHDIEGILDYDFSYIDPRGRHFRVRSSKCYGKTPWKGVACMACNQVITSRQFRDLVKRSSPDSPVPPTMTIQHRTHAQLCESLKEKTSQINSLKLKELSYQQRIRSLSVRIDDQKQLILAIGASGDTVVAIRKRKRVAEDQSGPHEQN